MILLVVGLVFAEYLFRVVVVCGGDYVYWWWLLYFVVPGLYVFVCGECCYCPCCSFVM